jgi:hypothetical protein
MNPTDSGGTNAEGKRNGGEGRIRTFVGYRRQIYSLLPLATRVPLRLDEALLSLFLSSLWSRWPDSNWQPTDYKSGALPVELHRHRNLSVGSRRHPPCGPPVDPPCRHPVPGRLAPERMPQVSKSKLGLLSTVLRGVKSRWRKRRIFQCPETIAANRPVLAPGAMGPRNGFGPTL